MPSIRTQIKIVSIIILWGLFSSGYFDRFPLPGFIPDLYLLGLTVVVAISAYGFGSGLVRLCTPPLFDSEFIVFSTVTGFGALSLAMVAMGVFGLWTHGAAIILVGSGLCLAWKPRQPLLALFRKHPDNLESFPHVPLMLIWTGAIVSLMAAFAPPIYYDTLVYHYALPQAYQMTGHWIGQPQLIYSAFPQALEMIWTLGMLLAGDPMANLLGWMIAAMGVWAVYGFAKRYFDKGTAAWSAALLSAMPTYLLLSSRGYVDVGLTVFSFTSFYALCLWREKQTSAFLILSGALAGCAAGTKYIGILPMAIGGLFIIKEGHLRNYQKTIFNELLYVISSLSALSPWLLKNFHYVGNPIFPFFYWWSLKPLSPWVSGAAAGYFHGIMEYSPRSVWGLFKLVWDIAVHGYDFGGGMDVVGCLGWAPLFAFLPAIALVRKRSPYLTFLLLYVALYFVPWGMTRPVLRFLLPVAPFLALGAAYGYVKGIGNQSSIFRTLGSTFMALLIISNARMFLEVSDVLSLFRVPLGFESRTQYLSEKLDYFDAASFVNTLPENSLTYVVGDQRGYYYNKPVIVTPVFNTNPLTAWANQASSGKDLAARLKEQHITHLLINNSEMERLDSAYHLFPFTAKGQANWEALRSRVAKPLYHDQHCDVLLL